MQEKRLHTRVQVSLVVLCNAADGSVVSGTMRDLSLGGAFIETDRPLPFGSQLTIVVRLPGSRDESKLPGVVRWANSKGIGVQFGLLGALETHALTQLLREGDPRE